jgi:hypothetical protein
VAPLRGSDAGGAVLAGGVCRIRSPIRTIDNRRWLVARSWCGRHASAATHDGRGSGKRSRGMTHRGRRGTELK